MPLNCTRRGWDANQPRLCGCPREGAIISGSGFNSRHPHQHTSPDQSVCRAGGSRLDRALLVGAQDRLGKLWKVFTRKLWYGSSFTNWTVSILHEAPWPDAAKGRPPEKQPKRICQSKSWTFVSERTHIQARGRRTALPPGDDDKLPTNTAAPTRGPGRGAGRSTNDE